MQRHLIIFPLQERGVLNSEASSSVMQEKSWDGVIEPLKGPKPQARGGILALVVELVENLGRAAISQDVERSIELPKGGQVMYVGLGLNSDSDSIFVSAIKFQLCSLMRIFLIFLGECSC